MSAPIGVGDFVECIKAEQCRCGAMPCVVPGGVYVVEAMCDSWEGMALRFVNVTLPDGHDGYCAEWFVPIYRPKPGLIESLKTVSREQVLA